MIISDRHSFAFVHIPKCGGTSVRHMLRGYSDQSIEFEGLMHHWDWGQRDWYLSNQVDLMHLPLQALERHFPAAFRRVASYRSFAVVRDPRDRFVSALRERMVRYANRELVDVSPRTISRVLDTVLRTLESGAEPWRRWQLVHFQRQRDYVELDGQRVVQRLYPLSEVARMAEDVGALIPEQSAGLSVKHENRAARAATRRPTLLRKRKRKVTNNSVMQFLRRLDISPPAGERSLEIVFGRPGIESFVKDYYAADAALFSEVARSACAPTADSDREEPYAAMRTDR